MFVPTVAMQAGESNTHADQFILHSRQEMEEKNAFKSEDDLFALLLNLNCLEYAVIVRVDKVAGTFI